MYTLDGRQKKALHAALRNAFPRPAALERLVEFHLDEHLAVIVGDGALDDVIFRLIAWAEAHGRLDALVNGARTEVPGNPQLGAFERAVVEARDARPQDATLRQFAERVQLAPAVPDEPDLEKRVFRAGFSDIAQWRARLGQAELAVCRIESPAWRALGTGFLVGPDLVMTNRHVVDALASQVSPSIVVRFDYKVSPDGSRLREGETFGVGRDWLVASSAVADLDFAVLRLAAAAGLQPTGGTASAPPRGWLTPQWRELEPDETVFVIQHPQGDTLKLASGRYDSREPTRLRYRVDTEPGSSGSPCFTAQMELVALHRGSAEGQANQGVPFDAIAVAMPAGFFTPSAPVAVAIDDAPAPKPTLARPSMATESLPPRRRWRVPAMVATGAVVAALIAVPVWWTRVDEALGRASSEATLPGAPEAKAKPLRRPERPENVPVQAVRLDEPGECQSDQTYVRALYRLQSGAAWPAATGPRARQVRVVAAGDIEIEDASIAMQGGATAATMPQDSRSLSRQWEFAEAVRAPVVVVVCVRSKAPRPPQPALLVNTWREVEP